MAEDDEGDECHVHVMIEALQRELSCVKSGLAAITHQLEQNLQYSSSGPFDRCGSSVESESAKNILPAQKKLTAPTAVPKSVPKLVTSHSDRGYYIGMLDSVERERCELKKKCFMLMQKRIEHQLETLRETSRRFEQKLHVRQEKAKLERLKRKPVRYRSDGSEDWSFLRNIYQSPFYQVAELAHTHRKAGGATTMATTEAVPQVRCVDDCTEESGDDDGDINGCTDSWAITALPHECDEQPQTDRMDSRASALRATPPSIVPVKLPQLRSIADILNEGGFGAHERKTEDVHLSKLRQLSGLRRTRHLMYQQAKCNQIAMMRLLQERSWNEFDVPIVSVPSVAPPLSVPALSFQQAVSQMSNTTCSASTNSLDTGLPSSPPASPSTNKHYHHHHHHYQQHQEQQQQQQQQHVISTLPTEVSHISEPIPLTMESIVSTAVSVKECKRKSTLWTNNFS